VQISMKADFVGRVANLILQKSDALIPVYEAISNSIQAIEETKERCGQIVIHILRDTAQKLMNDSEELPQVIGIEIEDTGVGFIEANFEAFCTTDTTRKAELGGKGVGRLTWLKVFRKIDVDSYYKEIDKTYRRKFSFSLPHGVDAEITEIQDGQRITKIKLASIIKEYQDIYQKSASEMAHCVLRHFLHRFALKNAPNITVKDNFTKENIDLQGLFEEICINDFGDSSFKLKDEVFKVHNFFMRPTKNQKHSSIWCGGSRAVNTHKINLATLPTRVTYNHQEVILLSYVQSDYLDHKLNNERTSFLIPERTQEDNPGFDIICWDALQDAITAHLRTEMVDFTREAIQNRQTRIEEYILNEAPKYKPLLHRCKAEIDKISVNASKDTISTELAKIYNHYERELRQDIKTILDSQDTQNIEDRTRQLMERITENEYGNLAEYLIRRKVILEFVSESLKKSSEGKYAREEVIHNIIFPMRSTSNETMNHNLWLIDERLVFHRFLASDKSFKSVGIDSHEEPDLLIVTPDTEYPYNTISIIELKRPMRNSYPENDNPVDQVYGYVEKIKNGSFQVDGRPLTITDNTKFFLYIICDLTPKIKNLAANYNMTPFPDSCGYYTFNRERKAYLEILSFEKILQDAKKRHTAFFDQLKLS